MSLQIRRDTEENLSAITPLPGEPLWSTDSQKLFVGNGLVAGGVEIGGGGSGDGYTGSQGTQGFTGSKGDTGFAGSAGADGFTGSTGGLGFTGSKGDAGFTGSEGFVGSQGIQGFTGSAGLDGEVGFRGSQGDTGFTGSKGDTGFVGSKGDQGYNGSRGDQGFTGSQGVDGYVGSKGDSGEIGYRGSQGVDGYTGSKGDAGYTGSQGDQGFTGSRGDQGYSGSQGDAGYVGSHGDQGFTGSQGDLGYTGSQGVAGADGDRYHTTSTTSFTLGNSGQVTIYTVDLNLDYSVGQNILLAFDGANVQRGTVVSYNPATGQLIFDKTKHDGSGTYANWEINLDGAVGIRGFTGSKGDTGFVGSKGDQGDLGFTGSQGDQGYAGSQGYTGSQGTQGDIGFTGSKGDQGYDGSQGVQGYTGSQGDIGFTGSQGDNGNVGDVGFTGSQGDQGIQGEFGYTGSQGIEGYTGSLGYTGSDGVQGEIGFTGSLGDQGYSGSQGDIGFTGSRGALNSNQDLFTTSTVTFNRLILNQSNAIGSGTSSIRFGDDSFIGDSNVQNGFQVRGITNGSQGWIMFGNQYPQSRLGRYSNGLAENDVNATEAQNPLVYEGQFQSKILAVGTGTSVFKFPTTDGTVGQVLATNGSGSVFWATNPGAQGGTGFTGSQGDLGYTGSHGTQGDQGYTGSQGDQGYTGSQGDQGYTGSQGDQGYTGSQGDQGYTGSQGDVGFTGSAGLNGVESWTPVYDPAKVARSITGNFTKPAGSPVDNENAGYMNSAQSFTSAYLSGRFGSTANTAAYTQIGFATDVSTPSTTRIKYGWMANGTFNQAQFSINGSPTGPAHTISTDSLLSMTYDGANVVWMIDNEVIGGYPDDTLGLVYLDTFLYGSTAAIRDITFSYLALNGTNGTNGTGFVWEGAWSSETAYDTADVVSYAGNTYYALGANTNEQPDTSAYWELFTSKGDIGYTGSGADTGDITFSGVKIQGAGTEGESGHSTIELVPDTDLYTIATSSGAFGNSGGQYLIVDPTSPQHIHIRAGGPIDEAAAQLILGGEKANVTVRDQDNSYEENHYVTVNTESTTGTHHSWIFGDDGGLTFPDSTVQTTAGFTTDQNENLNTNGIPAFDIVYARTYFSNHDTAGQQSVQLTTMGTPFTVKSDGFNFTTTPSTTIPVIRVEGGPAGAYKFMILAKDQYEEGLYRRHALEMLAIVDEDGYVFETGYAEIFSDGSLGTFSVEYIDAIAPDPEDPEDPGTPAYAQLNYTSAGAITEVTVTVSLTILY